MQQLLQDIQNQTFKSVYLLYGEEAYLRLQFKNRLKEALLSDDDSMNYSYYEGKDISIPEVIDLAETMPFFSDRRVIFMENTGFLKSGGEALADYISGDIPDSTVIVLIESDVDKRTKLYKAIDKKGRKVEFAKQAENTLKKWIAGRIKAENKQTTEHVINILLETVGDDMVNISMELEKLFAYTLGRDVIAEEDVKAVCSVILSNRIFEMIGLIGLKKQSQALSMYHELLSLKESPFGILSLINRQFNIMLQISDLKSLGLSSKAIGERIGMSPYIVGKYLPQTDCFTMAEMQRVLEGCATVDFDIKQGNIKPELGVELLIIESSSK